MSSEVFSGDWDVFLPRDFCVKPLFPLEQDNERLCTIEYKDEEGSKVTLWIGIDPDESTFFEPIVSQVAFSLELATLLCVFVRYWRGIPFDISWRELSQSYYGYKGSRCKAEMEKLRRLKETLERTWFAVRKGEDNKIDYHKIISFSQQTVKAGVDPKTGMPRVGKAIKNVTLHPDFIAACNAPGYSTKFALDELISLKSPIARACYFYLPSKPIHKCLNKSVAFSKALSSVFEDINLAHKHKYRSRRKQVFMKKAFHELQNVRVGDGYLQVALEPNSRNTDDNLLLWWVPDATSVKSQPSSKTRKHWVDAGGSNLEFNKRVGQKVSIDGYILDNLERIGIDTSEGSVDLAVWEILWRLYAGAGQRGEDLFRETCGHVSQSWKEQKYGRTTDPIRDPAKVLCNQLQRGLELIAQS